ncbi:MAG: hypothetical protein SFZ03_00925 [Candidatus Melainabacteria bacterium]|nr:hypothetical protein [Candidatus Melainabacteria bacterium]
MTTHQTVCSTPLAGDTHNHTEPKQIQPPPPAVEWRHFSTVDSTSLEALRQWQLGRIDTPTVIVATAQTAGRGTYGRQWASPAGAGLYFTLVIPEPPPLANGNYTHLAGIALAHCLRDQLHLPVCLKPVNDLVLPKADGAWGKLGGILTEVGLSSTGKPVGLRVGVGINLLQAERSLDDRAQLSPISVEEGLQCLKAPLTQSVPDIHLLGEVAWQRTLLQALVGALMGYLFLPEASSPQWVESRFLALVWPR